MKTLLTIIVFLSVTVASAKSTPVKKVDTIEKGIVVKKDTIKVAKIYKRKNSMTKRALKFYTGNNTKLA